MILIVGATGQLGGTIARKLLADGHEVRALVRSPAGAQALTAAGASTVTGDLKDPATLERACRGVDVVISTANSATRGGDDTVQTVDRDGNRALIEAAEHAGVRHFIFVSALAADPTSQVPFLEAKGQAEVALRSTSMAHTILRPNAYLDIWFPMVVGLRLQQGQPVLLLGEGRRRHSFVAVADVAQFAVAAVTHPAAQDQTLVIGGPEAVSWQDIVATTERLSGRPVPVTCLSPDDSLPGLPDVVSGLMASFDTYDSPLEMAELSRTYGVTLTSHEAWIRRFLEAA
jgi:uncharacterized protein YbjT (DUF2867 family)